MHRHPSPWRTIGEAFPFNTNEAIDFWTWHVYDSTSDDGASSGSRTRSRSTTTTSSSSTEDAQAHERARRVLQRMQTRHGPRPHEGLRGAVVRQPMGSVTHDKPQHMGNGDDAGRFHGLSSSPAKSSAAFGSGMYAHQLSPSPTRDPYLVLPRSPPFSGSGAGPASPTRSAMWMPHSPPKRDHHPQRTPPRGGPAPVPPLIPLHLQARERANGGAGPRHPRHGMGFSSSTSPPSTLDVDPDRLTPLAKEMWELERERRDLERARRVIMHDRTAMFRDGVGGRGIPMGPDLGMFA